MKGIIYRHFNKNLDEQVCPNPDIVQTDKKDPNQA
jgi:hypothetical protein